MSKAERSAKVKYIAEQNRIKAESALGQRDWDGVLPKTEQEVLEEQNRKEHELQDVDDTVAFELHNMGGTASKSPNKGFIHFPEAGMEEC